MKRKQSADYHALATKRGYKWLGPEVPNVTTKTEWQCEKGHTWQKTYRDIEKRRYQCPVCFGNYPATRKSGGARPGTGRPPKIENAKNSQLTLPAADLELLRSEYGSGWQSVARRLVAPHAAMLREKRRRASLVIDTSYISEYPFDDDEEGFRASHWISMDVTFDFELYKYGKDIQDNGDLSSELESAGAYNDLNMQADSENSCSYWYFGNYADAVTFIGRLNEFVEKLRAKK